MEGIAGRILALFGTAVILAAGCTDMGEQPSIKPQETAVGLRPAGTVPVHGTELWVMEDELDPPDTDPLRVAELGGELYVINCAMCHGAEGRGDGPVGLKLDPPPPDIRSGLHGGHTPRQVFMRITTGWGRMPSFRNRLSQEERWILAFYVSGWSKEVHGDK